jgi:hypothetical protein
MVLKLVVVTPAVLTAAVDRMQTLPAELGLALGTCRTSTLASYSFSAFRARTRLTIHVAASANLEDVFGTAWTLLRLPPDGRQRRVFLFDPGFGVGTFLVGFACLILMPRAVARDAGFGAALVALENVRTWWSRVALEFLLLLLVSLLVLHSLNRLRRNGSRGPFCAVLGPATRYHELTVVAVDLL